MKKTLLSLLTTVAFTAPTFAAYNLTTEPGASPSYTTEASKTETRSEYVLEDDLLNPSPKPIGSESKRRLDEAAQVAEAQTSGDDVGAAINEVCIYIKPMRINLPETSYDVGSAIGEVYKHHKQLHVDSSQTSVKEVAPAAELTQQSKNLIDAITYDLILEERDPESLKYREQLIEPIEKILIQLESPPVNLGKLVTFLKGLNKAIREYDCGKALLTLFAETAASELK